ncbi:F-box/kelch-repeat protein At1g30090-like [Arachis stenosperma]|uniref:F-box/kelch-repeat protein At1g30090-like n=1 Tax=Arachis stenosperma TaxID=217475 RepID=UPI0025ACE005|nr:F-box/kelch-repeat protein At1g30090-like [Arachis stenosperma]
MASYDAAVLNGKLLFNESWLWPFYVSPRGQVYDPRTDNWKNMDVRLREGWTGSSVVVYGHLFVVSELERMKLKVYDTKTDSWDAIDGPPLPEQICKPFAVNACNCHIYVVGRNLHVAVGHISRLLSDEKWSFSVRWHVIDAPESLSDLTPSSSQPVKLNLCSVVGEYVAELLVESEFAASGFGEVLLIGNAEGD